MTDAVFSHILVPTDGSSNAGAALGKAIALARLAGARLSVLTVYRHHSVIEASISMVGHGASGTLDDALAEHAREVAEAAKHRAAAEGVEGARAFVRNGPVARGIVEHAREHGVDLIVMGSRGMGSLESYLLGSTSHKVTGLAGCPVLVV
jgi:nucleotide-binding universal stress UspA family protein